MNKDVIEALRPRANEIALRLAYNQLGQDWKRYSKNEGLGFEIISDDTVKFYPDNAHGKKWASITFSNIRPRSITKMTFSEPDLKNERVKDVNVSEIINQSHNSSLERTYRFSSSETTSTQDDVGVSVGLQIRQAITYGGAVSPVKGETEITASINAHYSKTWGSSSSTEKEVSNTITVPPRTASTISTRKSVSDYEQIGYFRCDLDHDIKIWSDGDWEYKFDNVEHLSRVVSGYGEKSHPLTDKFRKKSLPVWDIGHIVEPIKFRLEKKIKFSNASSGNITITDRKL